MGESTPGVRKSLDDIQLTYVGVDGVVGGRHVFEWGFGWSVSVDQNMCASTAADWKRTNWCSPSETASPA